MSTDPIPQTSSNTETTPEPQTKENTISLEDKSSETSQNETQQPALGKQSVIYIFKNDKMFHQNFTPQLFTPPILPHSLITVENLIISCFQKEMLSKKQF